MMVAATVMTNRVLPTYIWFQNDRLCLSDGQNVRVQHGWNVLHEANNLPVSSLLMEGI
jgi:hypothetical protein